MTIMTMHEVNAPSCANGDPQVFQRYIGSFLIAVANKIYVGVYSIWSYKFNSKPHHISHDFGVLNFIRLQISYQRHQN
jgi:hypothetical protein